MEILPDHFINWLISRGILDEFMGLMEPIPMSMIKEAPEATIIECVTGGNGTFYQVYNTEWINYLNTRSRHIVVIMVGNVGAGKSTTTQQFIDEGFISFNNDNLTYMFSNNKYVFDGLRGDLINEILYAFSKNCAEKNVNCVIDCNNMTVEKRQRILNNFPDSYVIIVDFGKGDEKSLAKRMGSPRGYSPETWRGIHEKFQAKYEMPTVSECDKIVKMENGVSVESNAADLAPVKEAIHKYIEH